MGGELAVAAEAPGKAFERQVADAYRALGYQVTVNVQLPGKQTDILARQEIGGAPTIRLAIECKDHSAPIRNDEVHGFVSRVIAQTASKEITAGALVSRNGFTAGARGAASGHANVTLLSWDELISQILDIRHQARELVDHYESLDIFRGYLPLGIELLEWASLTAEASRNAELTSLLEGWMRFDGKTGTGVILVLADFGAGKTTLLKNIEYTRAKAHLAGEDTRIPLFVPLREYRKSRDVGVLLRASFREAYYRDLPEELLWQRIDAGGFYVFFDGFDEMLDRSNASRRLELFHELMPVLRSPSPTMLTSRPSYLVERGELDSLLATLEAGEAAISAPESSGGANNAVALSRLRRKLVDRYREVRPRSSANAPLDAREVEVVRLLPLDEPRIEEFVTRHKDELAKVGASVADLLDFIDRTYDLTDLASRPMLLNLIISSVVEGGLDVNDTEVQYGASGLYEVYTHTKLDLDLAKGFNRQNGLSLATRRMLAEALAAEMYEANALELDFHDVLEKLRREDGPLKEALAESGLTEQEVETDFATCSFVTLDRDGKCRFVHKSFRGFFIARRLKAQLPRIDPMLFEPMEREVLYFLGGFSPTEPNVGEMLWARFLRTEGNSPARRRNLLVAFLYSKPVHDTRKIVEAEISDAEFGRLVFEGTRFVDVVWRDSTVMEIALVEANWKNVQLVGSHFAQLTTREAEVHLQLQSSVIESWRCDDSAIDLDLGTSTIHAWQVERSRVRLIGGESNVAELRVVDSEFRLSGRGNASLSLGPVELERSQLWVDGDSQPDMARTVGSVVLHTGPQESLHDWALRESVLVLSRAPSEQYGAVESPVEADGHSLILAPQGINHSLLGCGAGVFGAVRAASGKQPFRSRPKAWGVLEAEEMVGSLRPSKGAAGFRLGRLLLVRANWYDENVRHADELAELFALEHAIEAQGPSPILADSVSVDRLGDLMRVAKSRYEELWKGRWPILEE
jgi:hypothetical protein